MFLELSLAGQGSIYTLGGSEQRSIEESVANSSKAAALSGQEFRSELGSMAFNLASSTSALAKRCSYLEIERKRERVLECVFDMATLRQRMI